MGCPGSFFTGSFYHRPFERTSGERTFGRRSSSAARRRHSSRRTHLRRPVRAWASFRRWITLPWIHNSFRGEGWSRNVYRPCVAVLCLARCGPRTRKRGREADRTYRVRRDSSGPRAVSADTGTNPPATALRAPKTGRRTYSKQKIQNTVDRGKTASSRGGGFGAGGHQARVPLRSGRGQPWANDSGQPTTQPDVAAGWPG
jgi:hypothetical protein